MDDGRLNGRVQAEKKGISGGMAFASFDMESGRLDEAERMSYDVEDE